jgi:hypothetical protein
LKYGRESVPGCLPCGVWRGAGLFYHRLSRLSTTLPLSATLPLSSSHFSPSSPFHTDSTFYVENADAGEEFRNCIFWMLDFFNKQNEKMKLMSEINKSKNLIFFKSPVKSLEESLSSVYSFSSFFEGGALPSQKEFFSARLYSPLQCFILLHNILNLGRFKADCVRVPLRLLDENKKNNYDNINKYDHQHFWFPNEDGLCVLGIHATFVDHTILTIKTPQEYLDNLLSSPSPFFPNLLSSPSPFFPNLSDMTKSFLTYRIIDEIGKVHHGFISFIK